MEEEHTFECDLHNQMIQVTAGEKSVSKSSNGTIIIRADKAKDGNQEVEHDVNFAIR
jgi:hypothetical protein